MTSETAADETSGFGESEQAGELLSRLRVIEDQPLETRAVSYVQVYDELRTRLEGSDATTARG